MVGARPAGGAWGESRPSPTGSAVPWIEALVPTMFATMSVHGRLAGWLAALPEPVVRGRPLLCLARAWLLIHRVELEPAAARVQAAAPARSPT